jgi:feruloyl esterase
MAPIWSMRQWRPSPKIQPWSLASFTFANVQDVTFGFRKIGHDRRETREILIQSVTNRITSGARAGRSVESPRGWVTQSCFLVVIWMWISWPIDARSESKLLTSVDVDRCSAQLATGDTTLSISVVAARHVVDIGAKIGFCELSVIIHSTPGSRVGAVYRLPDRWNGQMLGLGGGGQAGNVTLESAVPGLVRGYATAQTDGGHASASVWDTRWALKSDGSANWDAIVDFAYRAVHVTALIGKQVIAAYYNRMPQSSTFQGCSTGGRQALLEAQRFADDYDAIIAGAPVYDQRVASAMVAAGQAFESDRSHLTRAQIAHVHDRVLQRCDERDGLKDGIVSDPNGCDFDPGELACSAGASDKMCLSNDQVTALRRFYATLRAPDGSVVVYGVPYGSELISIPRFMEWGAEVAMRVGLDNFRIVQFDDGNFDLRRWDVVRDFPRIHTSAYALLQDATNPDLSAFLQRGGRLLMWHGLYDDLPRAAGSVEYFNTIREISRTQLERRGEAATRVRDQTRLFLAQGVSHCAGGPGADQFDALAEMESWQKGQAPNRIVAAHAPRSDGPAAMTRPWCAYPSVPHYSGAGDPLRAESFECR